MRRHHAAMVLTLTAAVSAGGCAMLGPDYAEPDVPVQEDWMEYEEPGIQDSPMEVEWWSSAFGDPVLNELVAIGLQDNLTLRSAGLRVLQARQQLAIAIGLQYPQRQDITGSAEKSREEDRTDEIYDLGFNVTWEADVWGRFRRQVESASAQLDASVADYDGVLITLVADIADTYLLIRTTQRRLEVARENVRLQEESVRITTAKFEAGEESSLDVDQAETLLFNTVADVYELEITLQQLKNSLAVLLGRLPQDLGPVLDRELPIPATPADAAVGMPQDLIRRRPDVRSAERRLAAQSAQIGFALTDLYPSFSLSGSIGTTSDTRENEDFGNLFSDDTNRYSSAWGFQWNIFNYGRLKSNVRLQDAFFQQLLEDYRQTVISAQADVENAIVAYLRSREQLQAYQLAASAARRAVDISTLQYQDGLVNFNTVIVTLESLADQEDLLAASRGEVAGNLVSIYRSLGGGWEIRAGRDPVELLPSGTRDDMRDRTRLWKRVLP